MACSIACVSGVKGAVDAAMKVSKVRADFSAGPIESIIAKNNGMNMSLNNLPKINLGVEQVQI